MSLDNHESDKPCRVTKQTTLDVGTTTINEIQPFLTELTQRIADEHGICEVCCKTIIAQFVLQTGLIGLSRSLGHDSYATRLLIEDTMRFLSKRITGEDHTTFIDTLGDN